MNAKNRHDAERTRAVLVERWPRCFKPKGAPKLPLKVGIVDDIQREMPEIGYRRLLHALTDYTGGATYLRAIVVGGERIDLNGEPAGIVTRSDADHALARLCGMTGSVEERACRKEAAE